MSKTFFRSVLLPLLLIPVASTVLLGVLYLLYYGYYLLFARLGATGDQPLIPTGLIRQSFALLTVLAYLGLSRLKLAPLLNAILMGAPLAMLIITAILTWYQQPLLYLGATTLIMGGCLLWFYRKHQPWFMYYSAGIALGLALFYAIPR